MVAPCSTTRAPPRLAHLSGSRYEKRFFRCPFIKKSKRIKIKNTHQNFAWDCRMNETEIKIRGGGGSFH
jgi:hypothetical protein